MWKTDCGHFMPHQDQADKQGSSVVELCSDIGGLEKQLGMINTTLLCSLQMIGTRKSMDTTCEVLCECGTISDYNIHE